MKSHILRKRRNRNKSIQKN